MDGNVLVGDPIKPGRIFVRTGGGTGFTTEIDGIGAAYVIDGRTGGLLKSLSLDIVPEIDEDGFTTNPDSARIGFGFSPAGIADGSVIAGAPFLRNTSLPLAGAVYRLPPVPDPPVPVTLWNGRREGFLGTSAVTDAARKMTMLGQPGSDFSAVGAGGTIGFLLLGDGRLLESFPVGWLDRAPADQGEPPNMGESVAIGIREKDYPQPTGTVIPDVESNYFAGAPRADYFPNYWQSGEGRVPDAGAVVLRIHTHVSHPNAFPPEVLYSPEPAAGANFGSALAARGDRVLVGAPGRDGAAYLFEIPPGNVPPANTSPNPYRARLTFHNPTPAPAGTSPDAFGFAVALVGDMIAVAAPYDDTLAEDAGAVYLFDAFTGVPLETLYSPEPRKDGHFGFSLSPTDDGRLVVGAPGDGPFTLGQVYVFDVTQPDGDGDGVPDRIEDGAPNGGDGNDDGRPDRLQPNVASLFDYFHFNVQTSDGYATFAAPEGTRLTGVRMSPLPPDSVRTLSDAFGYLQFTLEGATDLVRVQLTLHGGRVAQSYYQFGPEPDLPLTAANEQVPHWYDFHFDGRRSDEPGSSIFGFQTTLFLADGQRGDDLASAGKISVLGVLTGYMVAGVFNSDSDGDGVIDPDEDLAPNNGDGNGDGRPDRLDESVASLGAADHTPVTIIAQADLKEVSIRRTPPADLPPGVSFPLGFFYFVIEGGRMESPAAIKLPDRLDVDGYFLYGPGDAPRWYEFDLVYDPALPGPAPEFKATGAMINRHVMTLQFQDGQRGDADGPNGRVALGWGGPVVLPDTDGDGVADAHEAAGPNGGDGNGDGTPDRDQPDVATLRGADAKFVTLLGPPGTRFADAAVLGDVPWAAAGNISATLPFVTNWAFGDVTFKLEGVAEGGRASVQMLLPPPGDPPAPPTGYLDYSRKTTFMYDAASDTGAVLEPGRITLHLLDGGPGDGDSVANSRIVSHGTWYGAGTLSDSDYDGTADVFEDFAPGGDGNGDNVPDRNQSSVITLPALNADLVTLDFSDRTPSSVTLIDAATLSPPPPAWLRFPLGLISFRLTVGRTRPDVTVEITFHGGVMPGVYYKFGPEPGNRADHWYDFAFDPGTSTGSRGVVGNKVILELLANERGDSLFDDDTEWGTNTIVDPGGPAVVLPRAVPVVAPDAYAVDEDRTLTVRAAGGVLANDSSPIGAVLSAELVARPAHGRLALNRDGSFEYTPDPDFNGTDTFTNRAGDGRDLSELAVVTITVNPVDDVPMIVLPPVLLGHREGFIGVILPGSDALRAEDVDLDSLSLLGLRPQRVVVGKMTGDDRPDLYLRFRASPAQLRALYKRLLTDPNALAGGADVPVHRAALTLDGVTRSGRKFTGNGSVRVLLLGRLRRELLDEMVRERPV